MIAIINDVLLFDSVENLLYLKDRPELNITLTPTTTLLLNELLVKAQGSVSRDELLQSVWIDRGYSPSNASLNNNIGIIRKSYYTLTGEHLGLKTIPKMGFECRFSVEIISAQKDEPAEPESHNRKDERPVRRIAHLIMGIVVAITLVYLSKFLWGWGISDTVPLKDIHVLSPYKRCHFFLFNSKATKQVSTDITRYISPSFCESKDIDVFIDGGNYDKAFSFYTICTKDKKEHYTHCENYKKIIHAEGGMAIEN